MTRGWTEKRRFSRVAKVVEEATSTTAVVQVVQCRNFFCGDANGSRNERQVCVETMADSEQRLETVLETGASLSVWRRLVGLLRHSQKWCATRWHLTRRDTAKGGKGKANKREKGREKKRESAVVVMRCAAVAQCSCSAPVVAVPSATTLCICVLITVVTIWIIACFNCKSNSSSSTLIALSLSVSETQDAKWPINGGKWSGCCCYGRKTHAVNVMQRYRVVVVVIL